MSDEPSFILSKDLPNSYEELFPQIGRDASIQVLIRCSRSDYGLLTSVNKSFMSVVKDQYLYKLRREAEIAEHWIYISIELPEWEAFDPRQRRWLRLPTVTRDVCFTYSDKESLAVGTQLVLFGKGILSHVTYKYSLLTNSWTSGMGTITPRCLFASASLGEIAIVAGGCDTKGNILSSAELYNSEKETWHALPSMNKPRKMCSGVFMDEKFYAIGGEGVAKGSRNVAPGVGHSEEITSAEVYDFKTNTWVEIPNMFPEHIQGLSDGSSKTSGAPPLLAVVKNELYAAYHQAKELWKYTKHNNVWKKMGDLPEQVGSMDGWGMAFRSCGNLLVVIGCPTGHLGQGFVEIYAWEPTEGATPQWTLLGTKHSGNFVYNCAVMGC